MAAVLLLNADYSPIKVLPWERAVVLLLDEKVSRVVDYAGRMIRSASTAIPWPAVVALRSYARVRGRVKLSRANVLARDGYACMYCGSAPRNGAGATLLERLTVDHVVPRAQSRGGIVVLPWSREKVPVTSWPNVVTACGECNTRKGARTPEQAHMRLREWPRCPTQLDVLRMTLTRVQIPEEWQDFLPIGSAWREYWTAELQG